MDIAPIFIISGLALVVAIAMETRSPKNFPPGV